MSALIIFLLMLASPYLIFKFVVKATTKDSERNPIYETPSTSIEASLPSSPPLPASPRRVLIVLAAYLLSSVGLLFALISVLGILSSRHPSGMSLLIVVVWATAWICHFVMSMAWIYGKKLGRSWAIVGTVAGTLSVFPIVSTLLLVLPCFLLAIWLVRFHWDNDSSARTESLPDMTSGHNNE